MIRTYGAFGSLLNLAAGTTGTILSFPIWTGERLRGARLTLNTANLQNFIPVCSDLTFLRGAFPGGITLPIPIYHGFLPAAGERLDVQNQDVAARSTQASLVAYAPLVEPARLLPGRGSRSVVFSTGTTPATITSTIESLVLQFQVPNLKPGIIWTHFHYFISSGLVSFRFAGGGLENMSGYVPTGAFPQPIYGFAQPRDQVTVWTKRISGIGGNIGFSLYGFQPRG